jgi:hypothetical protein
MCRFTFAAAMAVAVAGWAPPARAAFISASGQLTLAQFTTPFLNVANPPPPLAIPFVPSFLPLNASDNHGATAAIGIGLLPPAVGVGPVLQEGSFLQETGPFSATVVLSFTLTYTAGAGGAAGQATAGLDLTGQLFAASSFAAIQATLSYAIDGRDPFASQVLTFDTRSTGIIGPGAFSRQLTAPPVIYSVPQSQALAIFGSVTYNVGQALLVAPPALSEVAVPAPAGVWLLASAAPLLAGYARRRGRPEPRHSAAGASDSAD